MTNLLISIVIAGGAIFLFQKLRSHRQFQRHVGNSKEKTLEIRIRGENSSVDEQKRKLKEVAKDHEVEVLENGDCILIRNFDESFLGAVQKLPYDPEKTNIEINLLVDEV